MQNDPDSASNIAVILSNGVDVAGVIIQGGYQLLRPGEGFLIDFTNPWFGDVHVESEGAAELNATEVYWRSN